jgi:(p)ppGpp synthase/HD superfamily hydrolase
MTYNSTIVKDIGVTDTNVLCAALLHDTLEDTKATEQEITEKFNSQVTCLVKWVTSDNEKIIQLGNEQFELYQKQSDQCITIGIANDLKEWLPNVSNEQVQKRMGKALYLTDKLNRMDTDASLVKLSDRIDNLSDIVLPTSQVEDASKHRFMIEYWAESKYMLQNLNSERFSSEHHQILVTLLKDKLTEIEAAMHKYIKHE